MALLQEEMLAMGLCDATGATVPGIALGEALLNSLYHGNLELPLGARREGDDSFHQLVEQRRQQPAFGLVTCASSPTSCTPRPPT